MTLLDTPASALLAQVVEVSGDAIFTEDLTGRVTSWNAAAERVYGVPAGEVLGRPADELVGAGARADLQRARALALAGERQDRFDSWHRRPDGRRLAVSMTVSPLRGPGGDVVGLATSVQDVSERVHLAAALEDAHRDLRRQYDAVQRSNRDLEQFAYVASHDLSEPLRVMTGFVQLLERRYADALDERGARYVAHVVDGAARMRRLIDDLLEFSRYLKDPGEPARVETAEVVAAQLRALGDPTGVEVGALPAVWCDDASVAAVVGNLLGNALKFRRPGTPGRVAVHGEREGAHVRLVVDDDGIGIAPAYRERVFGMFSRLHVREAYPGSGIGLAVVRQVAERLGGRAWVEDSPLGGCRVCVTLPATAGVR